MATLETDSGEALSVFEKCSGGDLIILAAPNVSEQMGGEGIKALHIFQELKKIHPETIQITHSRNRPELTNRLHLSDVYFVEDSWVDRLIWRSIVLRWLLNWWFSFKAVRLADELARQLAGNKQQVVLWQTEPNSPVVPRVLSKRQANCFGPINGNIYYPPIFRRNEKLMPRLRRIAHMPVQRVNRWLSRGISSADLIFCAGGERTRQSLRTAGCSDDILFDTLDCGIKDELLERPRISHEGENLRFVHFGRLVFHKGTFLIIEALVKATNARLDIVGKGPELERCRKLAVDLGVADRVNFLGWYTNHDDLFDSLAQYRGFVLPSLEDANGIVVQEAMAVGLPAICLSWGGPQLLVEHGVTGFLVEPRSIDQITDEIAKYMDVLAYGGALAESMSIRSRAAANSWRWSSVLRSWVGELGKLPHSRSAQ